MDTASILGLLLGIGGILVGNALEGGHIDSLIQGPAFFIVIGGTLGATFLSHRKQDLVEGLRLAKMVFSEQSKEKEHQIIKELLNLIRLARKETILSIEPLIPKLTDKFMQSVMRSVVDGTDPQALKDIFETQIEIEKEAHQHGAKVWSDAGGYSPTIGILGAVLGLIQVMSHLSDTTKLGSGIATAFVATIYGVGFANLIFIPLGTKLKTKALEETKIKEMILEGAISIQSGHSPHLLEIKLRSFLMK